MLGHAMTAGAMHRRHAGRRRRPGANTFALAAIPARYAMERRQWAEAMALEATPAPNTPVYRSHHALRARDRRGPRGPAGCRDGRHRQADARFAIARPK